MAQSRGGLRLADKILRGDRVAGVLGGHDLDGEAALEVSLIRLVHVAHASFADAANDLDGTVELAPD